MSGAVAVNERLTNRHLGTYSCCPRCGESEETINHAIFLCPPALQCWALSPIPSAPGAFPTESLFLNMDYVLSTISDNVDNAVTTRLFPWLIWYIWKARNDKYYSGHDRLPMDVLEHAKQECDAWFLANQTVSTEAMPSGEPPGTITPLFTCRIDGSWKEDDRTSGVGWILQLQDGSIDILGLKGCYRGTSPLHLELLSLTWALRCLKKFHRYCTLFVTDSQDLVKMVSSPREWPAFAGELSELEDLMHYFNDARVVFEPRTNNAQADFLARSARSRNRVFSFVNTSVPFWLNVRNSPLADCIF